MSQNGKGDKRRPYSKEKFDKNYDKIFKKPKPKDEKRNKK